MNTDPEIPSCEDLAASLETTLVVGTLLWRLRNTVTGRKNHYLSGFLFIMDKVTTNLVSCWFNVMTSDSAIVKRRWYQSEPENKSLTNKREPRFGGEVISFTRNIYFIIKIPPPSNHASCITSDYASSQNVTEKCLETSINGFYPSVNKLLWPFSSFWLAACSYPTPKQEASTLQGAKGFLLSPKIPSLLSVGAEGIRMFQEEPRFFLVHAFPLLCCQQSLKDSIWPCYTCFLKK